MFKKVLFISPRYLKLVIILTLSLLTLVAFFPVLSHDFLDFDDDLYISENFHLVNGLTWEAVKWSFSADLLFDSPNADFWIPLTFISHLITVNLFGMEPFGHHTANLSLHIVNGVLLFWVMLRMSKNLWPSVFVAVLFLIHPLHVESVAWVTERKDVLSTFFGMLTLWAYVRYTEQPTLPRYSLVVLTFVLGLMSKPMLVTLPFVLLLLDGWPLGRISWTAAVLSGKFKTIGVLWLEKVPLFALAFISSLITYLAVNRGGTIGSLENFPFWTRLGNAFLSYFMYIRKMLWPSDLAIFYPHPGNAVPLWEAGGAGLLLICVTLIIFWYSSSRPYLMVGWLWYLGMLVPVIGILQAGSQAMADRYTYMPMIGIFIIVAWGFPDLVPQWKKRQGIIGAIGVAVVLILMMITRTQVSYWQNDITLFEHALHVTGRNTILNNNLGAAYTKEGRFEEAVEQLQNALELNPNNPEVHNNLGVVYKDQGRLNEAVQELETALLFRSGYAEAHNNLGNTYFDMGRLEEAIQQYDIALKLKPGYAKVRNNLGIAYNAEGRYKKALEQYQQAVASNPYNPEVRVNLGTLHQEQGDLQEALTAYETAIRLKSGYTRAHYNLGNLLRDMGRLEAAIEAYQKTVALQPDYPGAYNNLGNIYRIQGRLQEAVDAYQKELSTRPEDSRTHNNLGIAYKAQGKLDEAVREYQRALQLNPDYARAHYNLGNVYAERGNLANAIEAYKTATAMDPDLAEAYYNLSVAYSRAGKQTEAKTAFDEAIRIKPGLDTK